MFDLEQHLRQWRRETEATLAFSGDELDELEDHLRFGFERRLKEGLAPGDAWNGSLKGLGPASALALEFAKDKLMPAMGRLLYSWWQPGLLFFLLGGLFYCTSFNDKSWNSPVFWGMAGIAFLSTLLLMPDKTTRNALLMGMGNTFCLIPLLHLAVYNSLGDKIVGADWSEMAVPFGWWQICLGVTGLILINGWGWKKMRAPRGEIPTMMTVAAAMVLLLALGPFCSGLIGNLSIREIYHLPTAQALALTGDAQNKFLVWKFGAVLLESMLYIYTWIPLILAALFCVGGLAIRGSLRVLKVTGLNRENIFPAVTDLPWVITLLTSGVCWIVACQVEPALHEQIRNAEKSISYADGSYGGLEMLVFFSAAGFLVSAVELMRRLYRSERIRPFYASMLIVAEAGVLIGITIWPAMSSQGWVGLLHGTVAQPMWLTILLVVLLGSGMTWQVEMIRKRMRAGVCELSLWKFEGKDLVRFGLAIGMSLACSGMMLMSVALTMAYISVIYISALIAWGNSISKPLTDHFDPRNYGTSDHYQYWYTTGFSYLALCLAIGLGVAMILSALEFIRFNSFRLYKMRKVKRAMAETLAVNE